MSDERNLSEYRNEDQIRKRPAPTFGTNDEYGAARAFDEIITNSVDEAEEGYGKLIRVEVSADDSIIVADEGRGLPMHWNPNLKKYNWETALCTLYGSGKYDSKQYKRSAGLNGLGLTATQYASEFMDVISTYDDKRYIMHFKKGRPASKLVVEDAVGAKSGTVIRFKPDAEVFPALRTRKIPPMYFVNRMRELAMTTPGVRFMLKHYTSEVEFNFMYPDGPKNLLEELYQKPMVGNTVYTASGTVVGTDDPEVDEDTYELTMKLAFGFDKEVKLIEVYHNHSHLTEPIDNPTLKAVKRAFTTAVTAVAVASGKMSKQEKFMFSDIEPNLLCVAETYCPGYRTAFKHQTKVAITNPFIEKSLEEFTCKTFIEWAAANKEKAEVVIAQALLNKQAREAAEAVSKKVIAQLSKPTTGLGNKIEKFTDCSSRVPEERELYIVEGDSAGGGCVEARDGNTQAILALRGKIINCAKESITKVLASDIIVRIWRVLQCGLDVQGSISEKLPKFDISKLNFGKIIISTDADVDGYHIRTLCLTAIYVLSPELLRQGKVYIVESPLYQISWGTGANESIFAYTDGDKDDIIGALVDKYNIKRNKITVQRFKGLGECSSEMLERSTMNAQTRRLIKVVYNEEDEENARIMINSLLGDDIAARKEMLSQYFSELRASR